jgi:phage tail-like protein
VKKKILGLNAGNAGVIRLLDIRYDPYMSYNFLIEIEGLITGSFSEVTGLESELEVESYAEGGVNGYTHTFPTRIKYPNLVLSHGLTDSNSLWDWYQAAAAGDIQLKNGTIMLLDRELLPAMWWNFKKAYPVKWVGPQFNANNSTQVAFERVELVHQGIDKPLADRGLPYLRAGVQLWR